MADILSQEVIDALLDEIDDENDNCTDTDIVTKGFLKFFEEKSVGIINSLTGIDSLIKKVDEQKLNSNFSLKNSNVIIKITLSDKVTIMIAISPLLATNLADMMMGDEPQNREVLNDDDIDVTREIFRNIFSSNKIERELNAILIALDAIADGDAPRVLESKVLLLYPDLEIESLF